MALRNASRAKMVEVTRFELAIYVPNVALYQTEPHLDGGFFNFL